MAATPSEITAELLIRFPGSKEPTVVGTVTIPVRFELAEDGSVNVTTDLSVFARIAKAAEES
ncbi:hypothetical protein [Nocardia sp. NBC_01388]|uniref:hypothetical protein n=1 Tax=Nocardia sp. NBC_01388 TaxID=2903596 RepID=UPI003251066B